MSGGSYDYLYTKDIGEALDSQSLQRMADRLAGLGYANDAATETASLLELKREAEGRMARLKYLWEAVEWWDSCDWGEDEFREALEEYRSQVPANVATPGPQFTLDEVQQILGNVGVDVTCGVCASIAFTGVGLGEHTCKTNGTRELITVELDEPARLRAECDRFREVADQCMRWAGEQGIDAGAIRGWLERDAGIKLQEVRDLTARVAGLEAAPADARQQALSEALEAVGNSESISSAMGRIRRLMGVDR